MRSLHFAAALLFALGILFPVARLNACSTYKITAFGKTMVGSNYDTWLLDPVIWFETNGYGCSFTGARRTGNGEIAPQTALNEYGLAFVTLGAPLVEGPPTPGKKTITNRSAYLKDIMHTCRTVDEVRAYVEQYDRSTLFGEVFMYTDSAGNYMVVEPFAITSGSENKYVLGNFCPSTITDFTTIKQNRYINGTAFLRNKIDSSLGFAVALSDTMHVCREKTGDGTLLTSVLDLNRRVVHLYFYHDYKNHVQFNLDDELAKGDHRLNLVPLFPPNGEYEKFLAFKTPSTSEAVNIVLLSSAGFFGLSALIFLVGFFRNKQKPFRFVQLLLFPLNAILAFYMLVLDRNEGIFYFPAPYEDYQFSILNVMAYTPFLLLSALIPLLIVNKKLLVSGDWNRMRIYFFTLHNILYVLFIGLFWYWGFYSVMH